MALLVFGPLGYIIYLFVGEIHSFIAVATTAVEEGVIQSWFDEGLDYSRGLPTKMVILGSPGLHGRHSRTRDGWLNDCKQRLAKY